MSILLKLYPSKIFSALLIAGYSLTILIVLMLPVPVLAKSAIAFLLVLVAVYYVRLYAWLSLASSPVAIRMQGDMISLVTRGGTELVGQVSGDSFVTQFLTVLHVLVPGQKSTRCVVIFPDSLDKESFREMRVQLKWRRRS